jgi:hypothetical protein
VPRPDETGTGRLQIRPTPRSPPGSAAFALDEGVVYHTYSAYARGLDGLWGMSNGSTELRSRAMRNGHPTTRSTSSVAMTSTTASDARVTTRQRHHRRNAEAAIYRRLATTTMLFVLVSPCSNAQVTRTTRLRTVLSDAHAGSALAVFGDSPVLSIW